MVAENPEAYARINIDAEFREKLQMLRQEATKMPLVELRKECVEILQSNMKAATLTK